MAQPYVGEIRFFAGNFAPTGWSLCDGSLLPVSTYTPLFSIIGTTYGGDGNSTFAVPDLRGRTAVHVGGGFPLGTQVGSERVILTGPNLPNHTHAMSCLSTPGNKSAPNGNFPAGCSATGTTAVDQTYNDAASSASMDPNMILPPAGSGAAHNNMQPFLVATYIIATVGNFPPRG